MYPEYIEDVLQQYTHNDFIFPITLLMYGISNLDHEVYCFVCHISLLKGIAACKMNSIFL